MKLLEQPSLIRKADKKPTLKEMQEFVEGYIELIALPDGRDMIINEEGKITGLPENIEATIIFRKAFPYTSDWIAGNVMLLKGKAKLD